MEDEQLWPDLTGNARTVKVPACAGTVTELAVWGWKRVNSALLVFLTEAASARTAGVSADLMRPGTLQLLPTRPGLSRSSRASSSFC